MKKISFAIILAVIVTNVIQAQEAGIRFSNYEKEAEAGLNKFQVTDINGSAVTINNVNVKAVKDFSKSCKEAEDIHWYIQTNGTFVHYLMNGNKGRRCYDKKGNFVYNILSYPEEFLPYAVRDQVKRTYYFDYNIILADEIQTEGKTIYIVHIKNKTTWKNIRVCNGEMDVLEEFHE